MPTHSLLAAGLASPRCIISVMGDHAGEASSAIFDRKLRDIEQIGRTFWLVRSQKVKPAVVRRLCDGGPAYVIFVAPSTSGGARPTETEDRAREYSEDAVLWAPLPGGLGPVTGKLDRQCCALVFDALELAEGDSVNLWKYADYEDQANPLRMRLGCSSVCAISKDMSDHGERMKSQFRGVVGVARLLEPYGVWVRP